MTSSNHNPNFIQAFYNWYKQIIRNPKYRWLVILGTIAYLISPIDIAPDFIPIIGQLDDVVLATLLVSELSQLLIARVQAGKDQTVDQTVDQTTVRSVEEPVDVNAVKVE